MTETKTRKSSCTRHSCSLATIACSTKRPSRFFKEERIPFCKSCVICLSHISVIRSSKRSSFQRWSWPAISQSAVWRSWTKKSVLIRWLNSCRITWKKSCLVSWKKNLTINPSLPLASLSNARRATLELAKDTVAAARPFRAQTAADARYSWPASETATAHTCRSSWDSQRRSGKMLLTSISSWVNENKWVLSMKIRIKLKWIILSLK